jgi:thiamine pyrophosphokinase
MTTSPTRAVVLAGGECRTVPTVGLHDVVVAADSGYDHAMALGVRVDVLVGDLDSISPVGLTHARDSGVELRAFPQNKDATDLELAIQVAIDRGAETIDLHGGEDGRIDHLLGVALSLSHDRWEPTTIVWHTRSGTVRKVTNERPMAASVSVGDTVSLVPIGDVLGVTTTGLRWPLEGARLNRGTSLGLSNESRSETITVTVIEGILLVIASAGPVG